MSSADLGFYSLIAIMSMAICMAIIPIMMRLAPHIGMVDCPDDRKVHTTSVPRSGGIGIVIGILVPLFIWLDFSNLTVSIVLGCSLLLIFGAWDDAKNLSPIIKFIGQILAAVIVVYYGEVYVIHLPFLGFDELSGYIGQPFTVIAIVGMINALNLSDGLDGLAGGESLISLAAISYLAYQYEGTVALTIVAATIGGIFGFLRFNSHPARIFMGDAGSQTLGFILAVLTVYLTQQVNSLVSPVIALFLLGLPIIDSLVVFYMRAKRGDSLVVAAKDHLHHRLLALGFYHYESVVIIYSIQIILVFTAALLPYESDILLLTIYISICISLFASIMILENKSWKAHDNEASSLVFLSEMIGKYEHLKSFPYRVLKSGLSLFIVSAAIMSSGVPEDFALSALFLMAAVIASRWLGENLYRLVMFITIGFSVYLLSTFPPGWLLEKTSMVYVYFIFMTLLSFVAARITVDTQFQITPLDYLVVILAAIVSLVPDIDHGSSSIVWMIVQIIILFYACELVIQNMKNQLNGLTTAAGLALAIIAYRGLA